MSKFKVLVPKKYTQNGEEKISWLTVGYVNTSQQGTRFLSLNMFPDQTFVIKEDDREQQPQQPQQEVNVDNLNF